MKKSYSRYFQVEGQGSKVSIFYTPDSGRIIYRDKIDTIIGIKHPGIILGSDIRGIVWVIHNHYQIGCPAIVTLEEFCSGSKFFYDLREVFYDTYEVIDRALDHWRDGKPYSWLIHNCQQFVNKIVQNRNYSEAIDELSDKAMLAASLITLAGLFLKNDSAIKVGLAIGGIGLTGKALNT